MAVVRKSKAKKGVRWQAIIRMRGHDLSRTFPRADDAKAWAMAVEHAIQNCTTQKPFNREHWLHASIAEQEREAVGVLLADFAEFPHVGWSLGRACRHYRETVTPTKKGSRQEVNRLLAWEANDLAKKRLTDITSIDLQDFIKRRELEGRAATTIRNDVFLISAIFSYAAARPKADGSGGWGLEGIHNPVPDCALPSPSKARNRRLEEHENDGGEMESEEAKLLTALSQGLDSSQMIAFFILAIETGMRMSELLDVRRGEIKKVRGGRYIQRGDSKNGDARRVILSSRAWDSLATLLERDGSPDQKVFTLGPAAAHYRWKRARSKAGIMGLKWHDLRHEGLSRMAGKGLHLGQLMSQSGHKDPRTLARYLNTKVDEVSKLLG